MQAAKKKTRITKRWLKSLGFYEAGDGPLWLDADDHFTLSVLLDCKNVVWLYCSPPEKDGSYESVALPYQRTRADVLRLCKVLCFPVKRLAPE